METHGDSYGSLRRRLLGTSATSRAHCTSRIGLLADVMAERVDAEGAVLDGNYTGYAGDEKRAKCRRPAAPRTTNRCRQHERDGRSNPVNVPMLPHY
jgi:hypothetical protein